MPLEVPIAESQKYTLIRNHFVPRVCLLIVKQRSTPHQKI